MGGKGRRRREKNYRAAHGGNSRLPPPPDPSKLDALPSKLRKIMSFASKFQSQSQSQSQSSTVTPKEQRKMKVRDQLGTHKETSVKDKVALGTATDVVGQKHLNMPHHGSHEEHSSQKKKKKRKRGEVNDLRFEAAKEESSITSKRTERKKKYREARKKKHKKSGNEDNLDFPRHEKIEFGDVVEAPPKLVAIPKVLKASHDASQERLRLQAIEAYRNRKGWSLRPGSLLPSSITL